MTTKNDKILCVLRILYIQLSRSLYKRFFYNIWRLDSWIASARALGEGWM